MRRAVGRIASQPPCPFHAAGCGGCTWQHVDAAGAAGAEVRGRDRGVAAHRQARRPCRRHRSAACRPGRTARRCVSPPVEHRLGLRSRHSHDVIELDGCPVSHPLLEDLLADDPHSWRAARSACASAPPPASARRGSSTAMSSCSDVARRRRRRPGGGGARGRRRQQPADQRSVVLPIGPCRRRAVGRRCASRRAASSSTRHDRRRLRWRRAVRFGPRTVAGSTVVEELGFSVRRRGGQPRRSPSEGRVLRRRAVETAPRRPRRCRPVAERPRAPGCRRAGATEAPRIVLVSCDPVSLARDAGSAARVGVRPRALDRLRPVPSDPSRRGRHHLRPAAIPQE